MRKEVPTLVAGLVIAVALLVVIGVYLLMSRPQSLTERPPIEEGVPATARPGGPTGRPGVTPTAPPTGILPSQPSKTAPR